MELNKYRPVVDKWIVYRSTVSEDDYVGIAHGKNGGYRRQSER